MDPYWKRDLVNRGGANQRLAGQRVLDDRGFSYLARLLISMWSFGFISAVMVQRLAEAATKDGMTHPDVVKLAKLGCDGKYLGNCRRDLLSKFLPRFKLPKPLNVGLTLISKHGPVDGTALFLPPTLLIGLIWKFYRKAFETLFGENPKAFWDAVPVDDPKLIRLQEVLGDSDPDWKSHMFPLLLHADGAVFTNHNADSIVSAQYRGLLSRKFAVSILPIWSMVKKVLNPESYNLLWVWTVFFFNALFFGKHPARDPWRRDWAEVGYPNLAEVAG